MPVIETVLIGTAAKYLAQNGAAIAQQVQFEIRKKITDVENRRFTVAAGVLTRDEGDAVNACVKTWLHDPIHFDDISLKESFKYLSQYCGLIPIQSDGVFLIGSDTQIGWKVIQLRNPLEEYRAKNEDCFGFRHHVISSIDRYYETHEKMSAEKSYVTILDNYIQLFLGLMDEVKKTPGKAGEDALNELENQLYNFLGNFQKGPAQQRSFSLLNRMAQYFDSFKTERANLCAEIQLTIKTLIAQARDEQKRTLYDVVGTLQHDVTLLSTEMRGFVVRHVTAEDKQKDLFKKFWDKHAQMLSVDYHHSTVKKRFSDLAAQKKSSPELLEEKLMMSVTAAVIFSEEARRILDQRLLCQNPDLNVHQQLNEVINSLEHNLNIAFHEFRKTLNSIDQKNAVSTHHNYPSIGVNQSLPKPVNDSVVTMDRLVANIKKSLVEIKTATVVLSADVVCVGETSVISNNSSIASPVSSGDLSSPLACETERFDKVHPAVESAKRQFEQAGGCLFLKNERCNELVDRKLLDRGILAQDKNNKLNIVLECVKTEGDVTELGAYLLLRLNLGESKLNQGQSHLKATILKLIYLDPLDVHERDQFSNLNEFIKAIFNAGNESVLTAKAFLSAIETTYQSIIKLIFEKTPVGYMVFQQNLNDAQLKAKQICENAIFEEKIKEVDVDLKVLQDKQNTLSVSEYAMKIKNIKTIISELERLPCKTQALEEQIELVNIKFVSAQESRMAEFADAFLFYVESYNRFKNLYENSFCDLDSNPREQKLLEFHEKLLELSNLKEILFAFDLEAVFIKTPKLCEQHDNAVYSYKLLCQKHCEKLVEELEGKIQDFSGVLLSDTSGFDLMLTTRLFNQESCAATLNQEAIEIKKIETEGAIENCIAKIAGCLRTLDAYFGVESSREFNDDVVAIKEGYSNALFEHARDELVNVLNTTLPKLIFPSHGLLGFFSTPVSFDKEPSFTEAVKKITTANAVENLQLLFNDLMAIIKNKNVNPVMLLECALKGNEKTGAGQFIRSQLEMLKNAAVPKC
ncbi:MAG: hypothetical protein NTZ67_00785 [Gammaproteobacteria bacterium]|nr:hypothetical protein [Gammaproteobacteria bacterium]